MNEITYLSTDDLKEYTPIATTIDVTLLDVWIPVVEQMRLIPIISESLDSVLKQELETTGTLTGNNATLWANIKNASAWWCMAESLGFLRTHVNSKGLTQQFSDNSQVASTEDYKILKQECLDKAQFYSNYLQSYLEKNKALFPAYRSDNSCYDDGYDYSGSGIYVG